MSDFLKCGARRKFLVLKLNDIGSFLTIREIDSLWNKVRKIEKKRAKLGKTKENEYVVINTDEPYANEIIEILKKNNHWG